MLSFRKKLDKRPIPRPVPNYFDLEPMMDLSEYPNVRGVSEETRRIHASLRERVMQSLNRTRPPPLPKRPSIQPQQQQKCSSRESSHEEAQQHTIRKSISSLSSSLKSRIANSASGASADGSDAHSTHPSVIRKGVSSMASSLRGLRSSRKSRDKSTSTQYSSSFPEPVRHVGDFSAHDERSSSLGRASDVAVKLDPTPPRLPRLEEIIANAKAEGSSTQGQSPKSNFSMSMFESLDGPFAINWEGKKLFR